MEYFVADNTVYRRPDIGSIFDVYLDGEWHPARQELAPSEQDYSDMDPITEVEALQLTGSPAA
jgi:hypothetical protein